MNAVDTNVLIYVSMIIAVCMESGVTRFYTEDFDNSISQATGVEIVNPF
jgi:predicted nucleic acid-binding protein